MKKICIICGALAMLVACDNANAASDYAEYDAIFAGCERIEASDVHLVYKCPADMEWIANIKHQEPTGMFMTGGDLNLAELYADTEHAYAEVALNNPGLCQEDFTIRTMLREPNTETNWAFVGCK